LSAGFFYKSLLLNNLLAVQGASWGAGWLYIGILSSVVYFYKIYTYLLLDFYKNVRYIIIYRILTTQQKLCHYSFIRWNFFYSILVLLIVGIFTVIVSAYYSGPLVTLTLPSEVDLTSLLMLTFNFITTYNNLFVLLYLVYFFVLIWCILRNSTRGSMFLEIIYILVFLLLFFL
jgi:hypothetical protein